MRVMLAMVSVLWLAPVGATAQTLEAATERFYAAEFQEAGQRLEALLGSAGLTPDDAVQAHRYLAAVRSLEGREAVAIEHAEAAVLLDPTVTAPPGASRLAALFDAARARTHGVRARLRLEAEDVQGARVVTAELAPAAIVLVSRTRIECVRSDGTSRDVERPGPVAELELPAELASDGTTCTATGLTAGGAALFQARRVLGSEGDERFPWEWVAVGAGVAVAALTVAVVVAATTDGTPRARVGGITVAGW